MAKTYPGAELEPCDNEIVPFPFDLFAQISLLARLPPKTKENIKRCTGAMRLRWFRQNEPICHQGKEDCTAFYILKCEDLETLRNYPKTRRAQVDVEIAAAEKKINALEAAAEKASLPKDRQKQLTDTQDELVKLRRELEQMPALADIVINLPAPGQAAIEDRKAGDQANQQLEQRATQAQDNDNASFFRELSTADPARKRSRADQFEREDAALAKLLRASAKAADLRTAAVVYLGGAVTQPAAQGWLQRLKRQLAGMIESKADRPTMSIPFDGPTDISLRARQANLNEGDLFGEMACLNRAPRTATVVATRDSYILEMLSNILTEIDKDPGYQQERNRVYKERVLNLQLRDLSIFRDLTDAEFARVQVEVASKFELVSFKTGELICDEHERSDCVYLIRSGLVQVKKNVSSLLSVADVSSWRDLCTTLGDSGPAAVVNRLLPEQTRAILAKTQDPDQMSVEDRSAIVHGLNEAVKNRQLPAQPELQDLIKSALIREHVRETASFKTLRVVGAKELAEVVKSATFREPTEKEPAKLDEWSELDHRRFNRLLLEEILPKGLRRLQRASAPEAILTYCTRGDFIGEIGVCKRQPRSSTCIAFGQPRSPALDLKEEDVVQVELVQIPGQVFLGLMELFPAIRKKVETEIPVKEKRDQELLDQTRPRTNNRPSTKEAARLGLIEGQQLMLIDMERCTLCGECVKGCVDSHTDGRSRLFLVGQRFDKYMVPMTCRSCLDPVCLIDCPVRSIQRGDNQQIEIKDWCIGCQKCAKNCPYDAIKMHDLPEPAKQEFADSDQIQAKMIAVVCDLCSSLADKKPRCVYACPHDAATRINALVELPVL